MRQIEDLRPLELLPAGMLAGGLVMFGVAPAPLIYLSSATIAQIDNTIQLRLVQE
jgi:NADH-quinone oxidoreductase subunit M